MVESMLSAACFWRVSRRGVKCFLWIRGASIRNGGLGRQGQPDVDFDVDVDVDVDHGDDAQYSGEDLEGLSEEKKKKRDGEETDSTVFDECEIFRVDVHEEDGTSYTVAPDALAPAAALPGGAAEDGVDTVHPEQSWDEYDWADDELTGTEVDDENEDEEGDASTSSSDTDDQLLPDEKHVVYINPADHRQWPNAEDTSSSSSSTRKPSHAKPKLIPKRIADCPVAIHEVKSYVEKDGQRVPVRGYVGFVGHVEDNRSMASLILGMCSVRNTRPLPEVMRSVLRNLG